MKSALISYLFLLLSLISCKKEEDASNTIPCIPSNLSNDVLAFYPFSNGTLNDLSGNNYHLSNTTNASPTTDRNNNLNCAFEFNSGTNSSDFLSRANPTFLNGLTEFSVSLWYYPIDTSRPGGDFETLISRDQLYQCPDRNGQWSIGLYDCRQAVFGHINSVWDTDLHLPSCQSIINARTHIWHHLVATYDQSTEGMAIYRDGVLKDSSIGISNCSGGTNAAQTLGDLFFGNDYRGKLDDIVFFDKVLTQQDVDALNAMAPCCSSCSEETPQ